MLANLSNFILCTSRYVFTVQCDDKEFRCRNGKCIQNNTLCNGDVDCNDESDELNCTSCKLQPFFEIKDVIFR